MNILTFLQADTVLLLQVSGEGSHGLDHRQAGPYRGIRPNLARLLLDSRVVDVPMSSNPIVVTLSSLKPFFFNGLQ